MREVQKSHSDYWDAINETSEYYVKSLADFSEGQVVLEEETVANIAKEITEFATGKLKEYGAKFPIVNKYYLRDRGSTAERRMDVKTTYKATHLIYELTESGDMSDPVECEIDGYGSVEELKAETTEVIEKLISDYKIPDGRIVAKTQIERKTAVVIDILDIAFIKDGKIKNLSDTVL